MLTALNAYHVTRNRLLGFWFAAVFIVIASLAAAGMNIGVATTALLLTMYLVPPGIILVLWRDAPTQTVGEVLYPANDCAALPRSVSRQSLNEV